MNRFPNTSGLVPFKPGQSGNPSGRPKKPITDALIKKLTKKEALAIAQAVVETAKNSRNRNQVAAFQQIADRVEGKPVEQVQMAVAEAVEIRVVFESNE